MLLAGIGLIISMLIHVSTLVGLAVPPFASSTYLHFGVFIVWAPAVLLMQPLTKEFKQKDLWRGALRGCPPWTMRAIQILGGYAFLNFFAFLYLERGRSQSEIPDEWTVRLFSAYWICFYATALAVFYSYWVTRSRDMARRCPNGHAAPPTANYCE